MRGSSASNGQIRILTFAFHCIDRTVSKLQVRLSSVPPTLFVKRERFSVGSFFVSFELQRDHVECRKSTAHPLLTVRTRCSHWRGRETTRRRLLLSFSDRLSKERAHEPSLGRNAITRKDKSALPFLRQVVSKSNFWQHMYSQVSSAET